MSQRIAVSILSDSRLLREALAVRLAQDPLSQFEVVAAASHVHGLLMQLRGRAAEMLLVHADTEALYGGESSGRSGLSCPLLASLCWGFVKRKGPMSDRDSQRKTPRRCDGSRPGRLAYLPCAASYATLRETICAVAAGCPTCSREVLLGVIRRIRTLAQAAGPKEIVSRAGH